MEKETMNIMIHLKMSELRMAIDKRGQAACRQAELLMAKYEESGDINDYVLSYELLGKAKGLALAQALINELLDKEGIEIEGGEE